MLNATIAPRISLPAAPQGQQSSSFVAKSTQPKSQAGQNAKADSYSYRSPAGAVGGCAKSSSTFFAKEPRYSEILGFEGIKLDAKRYLDQGLYDEVISCIRCMLEVSWFASDRDLLMLRGQAFAAKGDHAAACRDFDMCLQYHPNDQAAALAWLASATAVEASRLADAI